VAEQQRGGGGGLIPWLLVVALLGAVFWLASERNARHWFVSVDNGQLIVARGRSFPMGSNAISSSDSDWGKAYGPIAIPTGAKGGEGEFEDRTALDRALFEQVLPWAKAAAEKPDAASQSAAMVLAERASLLPGLSAAQLEQLSALRGDLSYTAAVNGLRAAAAEIESARRGLEQARDRGGHHAQQAQELLADLQWIEARLSQLQSGKKPGEASGQAPATAAAQAPAPTAQAPASPAAKTPTPAALPGADAGVVNAGAPAKDAGAR
jgi:hypothetical protein